MSEPDDVDDVERLAATVDAGVDRLQVVAFGAFERDADRLDEQCCCPYHPRPTPCCMMGDCQRKQVRLGFCERHAKVYQSWFSYRKWEAIIA